MLPDLGSRHNRIATCKGLVWHRVHDGRSALRCTGKPRSSASRTGQPGRAPRPHAGRQAGLQDIERQGICTKYSTTETTRPTLTPMRGKPLCPAPAAPCPTGELSSGVAVGRHEHGHERPSDF